MRTAAIARAAAIAGSAAAREPGLPAGALTPGARPDLAPAPVPTMTNRNEGR
jgi:hypothetical protein